MKVLIFAEVYFPDVMGGGEFSTKQMTEGLVKKGHNVVVYCLGKCNCEEEIAGVRVIRNYIKGISEHFLAATINNDIKSSFTAFSKILRKWPDFYYSRKWYKKYQTIIKKEAPDLIHTVSPMQYLGRVNLWKTAFDLQIPVSHVCRGPGLIELNFLGGIFNHFNIHKNAKASSYLTAMAAPSKFMLSLHNQAGIRGKKFNDVIYNTVDFEKTLPTPELIAQKENLVIYAGRLTQEKGIFTLIKAVNNLAGVRLLIIGSGELATKIKQDAQIQVIDWMQRQELYSYMKKAKAVILPAEWNEAFGRTLIEGIYNGTLGIGSDRGGIPEVLGFDNNYIFHAGNAEDLRQHIERVINLSPSEYMEEIIKQQNISDSFTDEKYVENWERFFLQQLN